MSRPFQRQNGTALVPVPLDHWKVCRCNVPPADHTMVIVEKNG